MEGAGHGFVSTFLRICYQELGLESQMMFLVFSHCLQNRGSSEGPVRGESLEVKKTFPVHLLSPHERLPWASDLQPRRGRE